MIRARLLVVLLGLGSFACGGSAPPKEAAAPEAPKVDKPAPEAKPAEPKPEAEPPKETTRQRKTAKEILLSPGWDFLLSFKDSDIGAKAEEDCTAKAKDDDAAQRDCMAKARAEVANDRLKFAPDDRGNWWLILMGKAKGQEVLYTKLEFKIAKEEEDKLVLTPVGTDKGKRPMKKLGKELVVEMPDEYAVVFQHPERGKLVFAVKVTGDSGPKPVSDDKPNP
jgi:hypothetical protein